MTRSRSSQDAAEIQEIVEARLKEARRDFLAFLIEQEELEDFCLKAGIRGQDLEVYINQARKERDDKL